MSEERSQKPLKWCRARSSNWRRLGEVYRPALCAFPEDKRANNLEQGRVPISNAADVLNLVGG